MDCSRADVLIVEDETDLRDLFEEDLKLCGINVAVVGDPNLVEGQVQKFKPRLIVMDLWLPGVDGLTVLEKLSSTSNETPISVLISGASDIDIRRAYNQGISLILMKPFLGVSLRRLVELARTEDEFEKRRKWLRFPVHTTAKLGDAFVEVKNISCGGCRVSVPPDYVFQKRDKLLLFRDNIPAIEIDVECRWKGVNYLGLEFLSNQRAEGFRILEYVSDLVMAA